ncbi:hypothetical protein [Shewanella livingstonensis]|uniref:Uncharacterized protein n=1 Tax=Shewanella livingstonensis TaxID=150120 RepID=A0A3G8LZ36_9GAMM|nr:hypothetical protein [Shewanella livingstonensis]AZG75013.1 hypothetical protein EGC82_20990 [Shewanella livingstonensis]
MFSSINALQIIQRLRRMRPLTALVTMVTFLLGFVLLLPLLLLFVAVGFIGMTLLGRQYMNRHRSRASAPFSAPSPIYDSYNIYQNLERDCPNEHSKTSTLMPESPIKSCQTNNIVNR